MGQVGERLWVLLHEPEGPLVAYLDAFASHLDAQGFKRHLLGRQIRQAAKFSRWLQSAIRPIARCIRLLQCARAICRRVLIGALVVH